MTVDIHEIAKEIRDLISPPDAAASESPDKKPKTYEDLVDILREDLREARQTIHEQAEEIRRLKRKCGEI